MTISYTLYINTILINPENNLSHILLTIQIIVQFIAPTGCRDEQQNNQKSGRKVRLSHQQT